MNIFQQFEYFFVQYVIVAPDQKEVLKGLFYPYCENCGSAELLQAVGVIGAIIMPHNIYLHSALVKVCNHSFIRIHAHKYNTRYWHRPVKCILNSTHSLQFIYKEILIKILVDVHSVLFLLWPNCNFFTVSVCVCVSLCVCVPLFTACISVTVGRIMMKLGGKILPFSPID